MSVLISFSQRDKVEAEIIWKIAVIFLSEVVTSQSWSSSPDWGLGWPPPHLMILCQTSVAPPQGTSQTTASLANHQPVAEVESWSPCQGGFPISECLLMNLQGWCYTVKSLTHLEKSLFFERVMSLWFAAPHQVVYTIREMIGILFFIKTCLWPRRKDFLVIISFPCRLVSHCRTLKI